MSSKQPLLMSLLGQLVWALKITSGAVITLDSFGCQLLVGHENKFGLWFTCLREATACGDVSHMAMHWFHPM